MAKSKSKSKVSKAIRKAVSKVTSAVKSAVSNAKQASVSPSVAKATTKVTSPIASSRSLPKTPTYSQSKIPITVAAPKVFTAVPTPLIKKPAPPIIKTQPSSNNSLYTRQTPYSQSQNQTENPDNQQLMDIMSQNSNLQSLYDQLQAQLNSQLEAGQRVNPDLTITPEMTAKFLETATAQLDPY